MLRVYKPINHKIKNVHKLMEYLVVEVWCKADRKLPKTRLNAELKSIYENKDYEWFKNSVDNIYALFKDKNLSQAEKDKFQKTFLNNNEIEKLCNGSNTPVYSEDFHPILKNEIVHFFSQLYTRLLKWKDIETLYGTKWSYYRQLVSKENKFLYCPCCGYGSLQTWFSDGPSAFDHYLPIKHYPLSSINFDNLAPICDDCNGRRVKGEKDILSKGKKKAFYPFSKIRSDIYVSVDFNSSIIPFIVNDLNDEKFDKKAFQINYSIFSQEVEVWNKIYKIESRYQGKLADNKCGWFRKAKNIYGSLKHQIPGYNASKAIDFVIKNDKEENLSFLKAAYLDKIKTFPPLLKAIEEVSGSSDIN